MITAKVDTTGLERMLRGIRDKDMPRAVRNTLRDIMKDTMRRERQEMQRIFKNPTNVVLNAQRMTKEPQDKDPRGEIGFRKDLGKRGEAAINALAPHIPGYRASRNAKGMEVALRADGKMKMGEYLVPSRTMKPGRGGGLNKFGNITGHTASRMLSDIGTSERLTSVRSTTSKAKSKFMWAEVKGRRGTVKGIWLTKGLRTPGKIPLGTLQMVVVSKRPTYAKRFRYKELARIWGDRTAPFFARKTVDYYITRKYG